MISNIFVLILLAGVLTVTARPSQKDEGTCDVSGADRHECGWLGINEATCVKKGCCWDDTDKHAKWCYIKKPFRGRCAVSGADRHECGWLGIDEATCLKRGCCWNDTDPNAKWCFAKKPYTRVLLVCEGNTSAITCGRDSWIHIIKANYGRTISGTVCGVPHDLPQSTQCYSRGSLQKVRSFCEGSPFCRLAATDKVYGDPCPRTPKYLEVEYSCNEHICGPVAPSQRVDCGWLGITKRQCQDRRCCWDDSVPNSKWCYYEEGAPPIGCYIYHGVSGTCRSICKPGERKAYNMAVCKGKICCYRRSWGK